MDRLRRPHITDGSLIDIRISSPYVATGQHHKVRKVTNSGTRLCSYVPETKNVVISEQYTLKTSNSREGILKIVSEFSPAGIIGAGIPTSTILLEVILGDPPDGFVEVLPDFKLKWTSAHAQKELWAFIKARERPLVRFTLGGGNPARSWAPLSGYQQDSCWSGRAQKAEVAQLDAQSDWRPGGRGFNPRRGRQHSFVEIDHEIFSTVILSLPLIQEGQLSVSGERMCTILVNRLED